MESLLRDCQYLRVLATSREPLGILPETTFPTPPLPVPAAEAELPVAEQAQTDAVQLFLDRARQVVPGFRLTGENRGAVAEICRRLDGLPLAIELAAARVRVLDPDQILARLEPPYRLLKREAGCGANRHRTILGSIGWSYDLCTGAEQQLPRSAEASTWRRQRPSAPATGSCATSSARSPSTRRGADLPMAEAVQFALDDNAGQASPPAASPPPASDGTLTRREQQVTALVAEGRTNKDIAASLVIAQRTAEGHVERIMMKLGFTSRAQVAVWVVGQQQP